MGNIIQALRFGTYTTLTASLFLFAGSKAFANGPAGSPGDQAAKFRQLDTELPTPNVFRNAAGAPGPAYWQQEADYEIDVEIDEDKKQLLGAETPTILRTLSIISGFSWIRTALKTPALLA